MFENVDTYESKHPDLVWTGYLSYCRACGDVIVRIDGDADVECSCKNAISVDGHTAGSAIERIATSKTAKYYANLDDVSIPVSTLREFGTQFKNTYTTTAPKSVLVSAMVPKTQVTTTTATAKTTKSTKNTKNTTTETTENTE